MGVRLDYPLCMGDIFHPRDTHHGWCITQDCIISPLMLFLAIRIDGTHNSRNRLFTGIQRKIME
jgi:hypothetical protein